MSAEMALKGNAVYQISDSEEEADSAEGPALETSSQTTTATKIVAESSLPAKRPVEDEEGAKELTKKTRMDETARERHLRRASPMNFFLITVKDSVETHREDLSIKFSDIVSIDHGELVQSLQSTMLLSLPWMMDCYRNARNANHPITVLCQSGDTGGGGANVVQVKSPEPWGSHHTKLMLLVYEDFLRVVVHTANLVPPDWFNRSQGLWISPKFPRLSNGGDAKLGESVTNFKRDLRRYFAQYKNKEISPWLTVIDEHDFSSANVFFIPHAPGRQTGSERDMWGLRYVNRILRKEKETFGRWPICVQCSSIGSLGKTPDQWLQGEFSNMLKGSDTIVDKPKVIFPTVEDVRKSYDGYISGDSLPYSSKTHDGQQWLMNNLHTWRSQSRLRTRASPHIKTYCRVSPDGRKCAWFLLTSANLSKAAWGVSQKNDSQFYIRSYEAGILFLPKYIIGEREFEVQRGGRIDGDCCRKLSLPWDFPPTPYGPKDRVWLVDGRYTEPDDSGDVWPMF